MKRLVVALFALTSACSYFKKDIQPKEPVAPASTTQSALKAKRDLYIAQQPKAMDSIGWPVESKCDGLLFCSLDATGGGACNPLLAEKGAGHWLRHPDGSCYPCPGGSCSENSKDQFLGLMPYLFVKKPATALQEAEAIAAYGEANSWYMGAASDESKKLSNELFLPPFRATVYELVAQLGGPNNDQRLIPQVWIPTATGYERHLQVLHIVLRGIMQNGIDALELDYLESCAEKEPNNALYVAAYHRFKDGDQSAAAALLGDTSKFPDDGLPTSANYCTDYLYQRDETVISLALKKCQATPGQDCAAFELTPNPDWLPCPDKAATHAGIDFIFTVWMMGL